MPARPLLWLTVFFMLGISADRLFGENLPVPTNYFVLGALILIVAMFATLWFRSRIANAFSLHSSFLIHHSSFLRSFAVPALLFVIFGMWASKVAALQFPQALQPFLNGQPASDIAEVSPSAE